MKHSLFTKLMSLFLAFALLVPCFPVAGAAESVEIIDSVTEDIPTEETAETTEATEALEETVPTEEPAPPSETEVPTEETVPVEEPLPGKEDVSDGEMLPVEVTEPAEEPTEATEELPEFIPLGMPEGYVLSEQNEIDRKDMIEHGTLEVLDDLVPGKDYAHGEILVLAESEEEAQLIAEAYCGTLDFYYDGLATILLGDATVPQAVAASLSGEYNLPVACPNYAVYAEPNLSIPSAAAAEVPHEMDWSDWVQDVMTNPDPYLTLPYEDEYQYWHDVIDTYAAWGVTTGQSDVTVAVIDTGVQSSHPDLYVQEFKVTGVNLTGDNNGHGTNVCGIIGATMDNGQGGAGVAPFINLHSYRVANSSGGMSNDSIYYAIRQATNNGADVINLSLGSYFYSSVIQNAINYAHSYDVTIVAAMGNDGTNVKCYPAANKYVIAVAATDRANRRAYFSNYGSWCDISAPGVSLFSTYPGSTYAWMSGTSQATPVVVGAIALYMSFYGNPGPSKMEKILESAATKCSDSGMGAGIVNAANMLDSKPGTPGIMIKKDGSILYDYGTYKGKTVPCESRLFFGTQGRDDTWYLLYTINGKTPSVKNGKIVNGTVYDWNGIDLTPYAGKTITVRVRQVSGMGISGKVLTQKIKVATSKEISYIDIHGPNNLIAGKEGSFKAVVYPDYKADQSVKWSIVSRDGSGLSSAKITQKGVLTTSKSADGELVIRATSVADSTVYVDHTVSIAKFVPVAKVKLDKSSATLNVGDYTYVHFTLIDKNGNETYDTVRWSSSDKSIASVDNSGYIVAHKKGKVTITCKALDGSGKSAKCTITVRQPVEEVRVSGNTAIAPGSSTTLKATIKPSNASNQKVTWTLESAPAGVTLSSSGTLKVPSSVTSGSITVSATAQDGSRAAGYYDLTIQKKITRMTIEPRSSYYGWAGGFAYKSGKLSSVSLFSVDLNESSAQDNVCALMESPIGPSVDVKWSSSNSSVASVDENGYVTAKKAGTAKITCTPKDGSKKTATVTVKVTNPVSYMEIKSSARQMTNSTPFIGFGKSVTNSVKFGDTYGKPGNTKVKWDYQIREYKSNASSYYDRTSTFKANKLVTISSSGKVTVSSKVRNMWGNIAGEYTLILIARSTDGSGTIATKEFLLIDPATKLSIIGSKKKTMSKESNGYICFESNQWQAFSNEYNAGFTITSSNPSIVGVREISGSAIHECDHWYYSSGRMRCYDLYFVSGSKKGTATITIKANDGSNKSCSFKVTVK